jgi:hypothetical protein
LLDETNAAQVIRWAIVTTHTRVMNRAVYGHGAELPV